MDARKRVVGAIRDYLARERLSREQFAFKTRLGKSTIDKLMIGLFSDRTLAIIEDCTKLPLRAILDQRSGDGPGLAQAVEALPLPDKPSIVVLPFANMSNDPEQDYFADGITEDLITALARFKWFFVIARNTSFTYRGVAVDVRRIARELGVRYVLEGSVRRSAQAVRITAQLVDAASGSHIWAERYDRQLADVLAIQDEIADRVVGAIEPELLRTESARAAMPAPESMNGWDLVRRGMWYFHRVTRETHHRAHALFRAAAEADPELPEAHIWLARVCAGAVPYGWSDDPDADLKEGRRAALKALELDEKNPYAHFGMAITSVYSGDLGAAERAAAQAVELSPSFALGHFVLGMARLFTGNAADAIAPLQHGLRLSPYDPQNFVWYDLLAAAHLFSGASHQAVDAATKALGFRPGWRPALEMMAMCLVAAGRREEAHHYAIQSRQASPQPGDVLKPLRIRNPQWTRRMTGLLEEASTKS